MSLLKRCKLTLTLRLYICLCTVLSSIFIILFPWCFFNQLLKWRWCHCLRFSVHSSCRFCWCINFFVSYSVWSCYFHVWNFFLTNMSISISYIWPTMTFLLLTYIFTIFLLRQPTHCFCSSGLSSSCFFYTLMSTEECSSSLWYILLFRIRAVLWSGCCCSIEITACIAIDLILWWLIWVTIHCLWVLKIVRTSHCGCLMRRSIRRLSEIWRSTLLLVSKVGWRRGDLISIGIASIAQTSACWWMH